MLIINSSILTIKYQLNKTIEIEDLFVYFLNIFFKSIFVKIIYQQTFHKKE